MSQSLVTVATFDSPPEAELARNRLEEEGISALLVDAETVGTLWYVGTALGGVKVQVEEADAPRARAILSRLAHKFASRELDDYGLLSKSGKAPREHVEGNGQTVLDDETRESEADATARRAWRSAVIGLVVCPLLLHLYSAWLLLQLPWTEEPFTPAGKRLLYGALVIDILVLGLAALFWITLGPSFFRAVSWEPPAP
jgi:hypothetical protein